MTTPLELQAGQTDRATARLLLSATQIAQLARVQRPVVSMWRTRFSDGADAFPRPVEVDSGVTLFDGQEIATWLVDTGHGNNADANEDLAAYARSIEVDLNNRAHRTVVEALLAYRAVLGTPLTGDSGDPGEPREPGKHGDSQRLTSQAALLDPGDRAFRSEIEHRPAHVNWERYVDDLVDGAYSVEGAWQRLQEMSTQSAVSEASPGDLSAAATGALARIVLALMPPETLDLALAAGRLADARTVTRVLRAAPEHLNISVSITEPAFDDLASPDSDTVADRADARHLARYLLAHGEQINTESSPATLFVARLRGIDPATELTALEDLVIELGEWQSALVLGPDAVLIDALEGPAEAARDALLRSGRVRAIVRLPAGWVPTAVRQSLALWVIGGSQRDQGIGERISAIGDLRGPALSQAAVADLATDISSVMGSPALARSHAFRHLRVMRTSMLLAGDGPLDARGARTEIQRPSTASGLGTIEFAARIDDALSQLPMPLPAVSVTPGRSVATTTVDAQLRQGRLRLLQGARISREHCIKAVDGDSSDGYSVIGADEVRAGGAGHRRIDRMLLLAEYPRAGLSEAGDVIFLAGSRPAAWVDRVGLSVVEYPARILRIVPESKAGGRGLVEGTQVAAEQLVPELLAADLAAAQPGSPWRQCRLRRVSGEQRLSLSEALASLQAERMRLERQATDIANAERLLLDGVAAGVVLQPSSRVSPTKLNHSSTTEGTR